MTTPDATPQLQALAQALGSVPPPCRAVPPEIFYEQPEAAVKLCQDCHGQRECLEYAQALSERWGVWGGVNLERPQGRRPA